MHNIGSKSVIASFRTLNVSSDRFTFKNYVLKVCFNFFLRNRAIADYLRSNGYEEAYSTFKKEAELDMVRREVHNNEKVIHVCLPRGMWNPFLVPVFSLFTE